MGPKLQRWVWFKLYKMEPESRPSRLISQMQRPFYPIYIRLKNREIGITPTIKYQNGIKQRN